jgi:signal transduction histidine kinase
VTPAGGEGALAEERARRVAAESERDEYKRMNDAKSKLLSLISHELKSPLTGISAFAEMLSENSVGNLTDRQLQQVRLIRRSADQLELLINDLLDLSRLDSGEFRLEIRDFSAREMLVQTAEAVEPVMRHQGQRLDLDVKAADGKVRGDPGRLGQVVTNLLTNASKFSPKGAEVKLRAEVDDRAFRVRVRDPGIGICEEDSRRLFTAFFRADNPETRSVPGTGLGLYIANSIVRLHGGTISVESKRGGGSTFTVEVPRYASELARSKPVSARVAGDA